MHHKRYVALVTSIALLVLFTAIIHAQTIVEPKPDAAGLLPEFNRWRTAIGIRPYLEDVRLSRSAQFHTDDQISRNYAINHIAPSPVECNGKMVTTPAERAACFGTYDRGEGITMGGQNADEATRSWLHSEGHCWGVMNATATHLGGGNNGNVWTFQFNGENNPNPPIDYKSFCGCTSRSDGSEAAIQACVVDFNNRFNNGITPPVPPPSSLQITSRRPDSINETLGQFQGARGYGLGLISEGTITVRTVSVTGDASGAVLDLVDDPGGFDDKIPGGSGIDSVTYTVTEPMLLSVWVSAANVAADARFFLEIFWESSYVSPTILPGGNRTTTIEPTAAPAEGSQTDTTMAGQSACSAFVGTVEELSSAINRANDETACPGVDTLTLTANLEPIAPYADGGDTAFPAITSHIIISGLYTGDDGSNFTITRGTTDFGVSDFRFFLVDGTNGSQGVLELQHTSLIGGRTSNGGAVLVDARGGGEARLVASNVVFSHNIAQENGGAVATLSFNGGHVTAAFDNTIFSNNKGSYGGAFYSGGFDGGNASATITNAFFTENEALVEGGAVYNNGLGANGSAVMSIENSAITFNVSPRGDAIHNNGRTGGNATLTLTSMSFSSPNALNGSGGSSLIINQGVDGSAIMLWSGSSYGGAENACFNVQDVNGALESAGAC